MAPGDHRPSAGLHRPAQGKAAQALPARSYPDQASRWLDADTRAEELDIALANTDFLYDSLPVAWPNLGPGIFSAWCGCGYRFAQGTAWTKPMIDDWAKDFEKPHLDLNHPLFLKTVELTQKLLARGRGKFIVGLTDFHPGGDHLAALRGTERLLIDLLYEPEPVKRMLEKSLPEYFTVYNIFYKMLREAGMPITTWTSIVHDGSFYLPSNDFSCMISKKMYDEFFLPGIAQECAFYDRSLYHLDGPGALKHLDSLLEIKDLDAVQWVCGYGNEGFSRWKTVYQKIQRAGKGIQLMCHVRELDEIFEVLRPEGVWFSNIDGIEDRETAQYAVERIKRWK